MTWNFMPDCASNKLTNCSSDWRGKQVNFAAEAASSLGKPETRVLQRSTGKVANGRYKRYYT